MRCVLAYGSVQSLRIQINYMFAEHCGGIYLKTKQYCSTNSRMAKSRFRGEGGRKMFVLEKDTELNKNVTSTIRSDRANICLLTCVKRVSTVASPSCGNISLRHLVSFEH